MFLLDAAIQRTLLAAPSRVAPRTLNLPKKVNGNGWPITTDSIALISRGSAAPDKSAASKTTPKGDDPRINTPVKKAGGGDDKTGSGGGPPPVNGTQPNNTGSSSVYIPIIGAFLGSSLIFGLTQWNQDIFGTFGKILKPLSIFGALFSLTIGIAIAFTRPPDEPAFETDYTSRLH